MLWQALFWQLSGGPCAPGGAFVGPINEERRMALLELCSAWPWLLGAMASLWSAMSWPGRALWQALFWQLSGGPCAPGGAFVGPIFEEGRMAMLELCPAQDKPDKAAFPFIFESTGACPSTFHEGLTHCRRLARPYSLLVCFVRSTIVRLARNDVTHDLPAAVFNPADRLQTEHMLFRYESVRAGRGF